MHAPLCRVDEVLCWRVWVQPEWDGGADGRSHPGQRHPTQLRLQGTPPPTPQFHIHGFGIFKIANFWHSSFTKLVTKTGTILGSGYHTDKKENQIFLIHKEIQMDQLQSHIWLTASSRMVKYLRISSYTVLGSHSSYMTLQLLHLNFLTWEKFDFLFLSPQFIIYLLNAKRIDSQYRRSRQD